LSVLKIVEESGEGAEALDIALIFDLCGAGVDVKSLLIGLRCSDSRFDVVFAEIFDDDSFCC
jgi:hypothetical protein